MKPNNFFKAIPDKQIAMRTLQMFKDEYMLDFINVEEIKGSFAAKGRTAASREYN